jgi:L-alanine-DL-glutamate epimerase-like enolase superfamily enzyme
MRLRLYEFDLPLRHVFTISRGSVSVQKTLIVELEENGLHGFGEATTNPYYGATIENMVRALEGIRSEVQRWTPGDPAAFWDSLRPALRDQPFAHCALDQAACDLWGKKLGKPVYKLWGLSLDDMPVSNYTIGIDEIDVMVAKLEEFPDWPIYKIKLGTAHDLQIVRQLRQHTQAVFRVDANCGWSEEETLHNAAKLKELNVEFIEQPLPADQWETMRRIRTDSSLPVIADESCVGPDDVDRCDGCFHGVNIKLVKCGGLTPARRMIARARQLGMKTMVGCMTESTVGISAIAQLLPLLDYVDMDGAVLLAEDIATGASVRQGVCHYPDENGSGVHLHAASRGKRVG